MTSGTEDMIIYNKKFIKKKKSGKKDLWEDYCRNG